MLPGAQVAALSLHSPFLPFIFRLRVFPALPTISCSLSLREPVALLFVPASPVSSSRMHSSHSPLIQLLRPQWRLSEAKSHRLSCREEEWARSFRGEQLQPEGEIENPGMLSPTFLSRPLQSGDKGPGPLTTRASPNQPGSQPARQSRRRSFSSASRPHYGSLRIARHRVDEL